MGFLRYISIDLFYSFQWATRSYFFLYLVCVCVLIENWTLEFYNVVSLEINEILFLLQSLFFLGGADILVGSFFEYVI